MSCYMGGMEIAYVAYTDAATFMLDGSGVCRWVTSVPGSTHSKEAADRCVGAQYVASIDANVDGALIELPRLGTPMIFAAVGANGRISLVRTGPLLKFEAKRKPQSGVHERPTRPTGFQPVQLRPLRDDAIIEDINDVYYNEPATSRFTPARPPPDRPLKSARELSSPPPRSAPRTMRASPPPPAEVLRRMVGAPARAMRDEGLDETPNVYRVPVTAPRMTTTQARAQGIRRGRA